MRKFHKDRREFIGQVFQTLGLMLMPVPIQLFSSTARAQGKGKRQHLITIIDNGAWDMAWFLNYFDPYLNTKTEATPSGWDPLGKVRYGSQNTRNADAVIHPTGALLAPGMKFWSAADYNRFFIVRGMQATAGHNQQQFIYGGGTSPYMASASAIIAAYQADTRGPSALHYVKLLNGTRDLIHSAMMNGIAIPSLMPNQDAWKTLTSSTSSTPYISSVESAIGELGKIAQKKLNRDASKNVVSGYMNGYGASVSLSSSNYAASEGFINLWYDYFTAIKSEVSNHLTQAGGLGKVGGFNVDTLARTQVRFDQKGIPQPTRVTEQGVNTFSKYFNEINNLMLQSNFKDRKLFLEATSGDSAIQTATQMAWKFAMTEFLVVNDLSAVVDLNPSGYDSHNVIITPTCNLMMSLACVRTLAERLSKIKPADCNGDSLLDRTLISYASEFERGAKFSSDVYDSWGTSHSNSFSLLLAGHRSNTGKVLGELSRGDSANVENEFRSNEAPKSGGDFGMPLSFDPVTGARTPGKEILNSFSYLPSILEIFNVPLPPQQITDFKKIPFFIKS